MSFAVTTSDLATTSGIHIPWVLFRNPTGSKIWSYIFAILNSTTVSSGNHIFRSFMGPTVTSTGTLLPSASLWSKYPPLIAKSLIYSKPTVSANGVQFSTVVAGVTFTTQQDFSSNPIILPPGYDLLITARANTGSLTAATDIYFDEYALT